MAVIKTAEYTGKMGLGLAAGGADGEDFVAAVGNQHLMFPLRWERAVFGDYCPAVGQHA